MIINFSVENWLSFREKTSLTMVATDFQRHSKRLAKSGIFETGLLPISMIFGGNASGKSNFIQALSFARKFVLEGTISDQLIAVKPFLLDDKSEKKDTKFVFDLLIDELAYEFSFALNFKHVTKERLLIKDNKGKRLLFDRTGGKITLGDSVKKFKNKEELEILEHVSRTTRDNLLFLTNSILQNMELFRPVHNWFAKSLVVVGPNSNPNPFHYQIDSKDSYIDFLNEVTPKLDVGISSVMEFDFPFDSIEIPDEMHARISNESRMSSMFVLDITGDLFIVTRGECGLKAKKLKAQHFKSDGSESVFDFEQESDGAKRIMGLLPAFYNLISNKQVVFVDGIDRSMHSTLVQRLVDSYLENCSPKSRSQLIFTTHSLEVMNSRKVRPDEIWVAEKVADNASELHSLCEYEDSQHDGNFLKSYLQGRFGGVPNVQIGGIFNFSGNE